MLGVRCRLVGLDNRNGAILSILPVDMNMKVESFWPVQQVVLPARSEILRCHSHITLLGKVERNSIRTGSRAEVVADTVEHILRHLSAKLMINVTMEVRTLT